MKKAALLLMMPLMFAVSCKWQENGRLSGTKFDNETSEALADVVFDPTDEASFCSLSTLIVFVGNAESLGHRQYLNTTSPAAKTEVEAALNANEAGFKAAIDAAGAGLADALSRNSCIYNSSGKHGEIQLARIIDGPGQGDSTITTTHYHWVGDQWMRDPDVSWVYDFGHKSLAQGRASFELNMATDLPPVVSELLKAHGGGYEQIFYFFKTHGGLYTAQPATGLFDRGITSDAQHVFLFDTHGPEGDLSSALYYPFWSRKTACQLYQTAGRSDLLQDDNCVGKPLVAANNDSPKAGPNGVSGVSDGTSGISDGTSGVTDGTSGVTDGTSGVTDGTSGVTDGTSGVTDGTSGVTDGTSGVTDGTSGVTDGTSGAGKGMLHLLPLPPNSGSTPSVTQPEGYVIAGEAATYNNTDALPAGVHALSLPTGTSSGGVTFVLMDSCYGSDRIATAIFDAFATVRGWVYSRWHIDSLMKFVVLSNPNPLYFNLLKYNTLDAKLYLSLPFVLNWGLNSESGKQGRYRDIAQRLNKHFSKVGISETEAGGNISSQPVAQRRLYEVMTPSVFSYGAKPPN